MKTLKIAKYQANDLLAPVKVFYIVLLSVIIFLGVLNAIYKGNMTSSGLDFASMIFLFVAGLNSFKGSFKFSQANNISRKTYFKGSILGALPVTLGMAVIDIIINRIYNLFVLSPMNFDMIYGKMLNSGNLAQQNQLWVQSNDIKTLVTTLLFQFTLYTMVFIFGVLITMIYFRSNKIMKVVVSVSPFLFLIFLPKIFGLFPRMFWKAILDLLGFSFRGPYNASLTFVVLSAVFAGFSFLLCKRAVAKD